MKLLTPKDAIPEWCLTGRYGLQGLARRNSDLDSIRDRPEIAELLTG